jgi:circadian clock protein KaiC
MISNSEFVRLGIPGVDEVLMGGILRGDTILVQGAPGTGKTTFGLQVIYAGALYYNEPGLIVTFEQFPKQMFRDAKHFGWDFESLIEQRKIYVIATSPHVFQKQLQSPDGIIHKTLAEMDIRRVLIDSITHFQRITTDEIQLREMISGLLNMFRQREITTILTQEVHQSEHSFTFEEYTVDAVIRLSLEPIDKVQRRRFLEVLKARGQAFLPGKHSMAIESDGIHVYPAPYLALTSQTTSEVTLKRVPSGVPGLDRMLGGGLYEGFCALLAGDVGAGKSMLVRQFIAYGAQRGEPGLYVVIRETPEQILKVSQTVGLNLQPLIEAGMITILHYNMGDLDPYKLFWDIHNLVTRKNFKRAAIDSLSDIQPSLMEQAVFRDYVGALRQLFLSHNITSILTFDLRPTTVEQELIESEIALLFDAILALRLRNIHDHMRKTITVLKMRGSEHDAGIRYVRIEPGEGMIVETGFEGMPSFLRRLQQLSMEAAREKRGLETEASGSA